MEHLLDGNRMAAVMIGGGLMALAAVLVIPRSGERGCGKTVTGNKQLKAVFN